MAIIPELAAIGKLMQLLKCQPIVNHPPVSMRYVDPYLGFAVEYPHGWEVLRPTVYEGDPTGRWDVVTFVSNLYAGDSQAIGEYTVTVAVQVGEDVGKTLTETVEYRLAPMVPGFRDRIRRRCCLTVGGEPAMELTGHPGGRWDSRQIVVIHDGREYRLTFYPHFSPNEEFKTSSDVAARAEFDAFLRTFTFIPITVTATPPITPAPTPTG